MTADEFQAKCLRTLGVQSGRDTLELCGFGLGGESAEVLEAALAVAISSGKVSEKLKKFLFHGKELDIPHVAEELGDVLWYAAVLADELGYTLSEVMAANVAKLEKRHGVAKQENG